MTEELKPINQVTSSLDQPMPTHNPNNGDIWKRLIDRYSLDAVYKTDLCRNISFYKLDKVRNLMIERRELGIARYNTVLQPFNGRDVIDDLLAEQLDSIAYSEQASLEYSELTELMIDWQKSTIAAMQKLIAFKEIKNASKNK